MQIVHLNSPESGNEMFRTDFPEEEPQMMGFVFLLGLNPCPRALPVVNTGMLQFSIWDQLLLTIRGEDPGRVHPGAVGGSEGEPGVPGGRYESVCGSCVRNGVLTRNVSPQCCEAQLFHFALQKANSCFFK